MLKFDPKKTLKDVYKHLSGGFLPGNGHDAQEEEVGYLQPRHLPSSTAHVFNQRVLGVSTPPVIEEDVELVTPPPHLVHPSAGLVRWEDLKAIEELHQLNSGPGPMQSNRTILKGSPDTVPLVESAGGVDFAASPTNRIDWAGLFKG